MQQYDDDTLASYCFKLLCSHKHTAYKVDCGKNYFTQMNFKQMNLVKMNFFQINFDKNNLAL